MSPVFVFAQLGVKAGLNFANVSNAKSINNSSKSGFHAGVFLAPASKGVIGSRTELIFSRQGYNYKTGVKTGAVNLDYIMIPQFIAINITKYFSLHLGAQMAILLNAKVDSSATTTTPMPGYANGIMNLYNRFDYGYAVGAEVHPVKGLILGARYNVSLGKVYKSLATGEAPSFTSEDAKNNLIQIFAGWRFGQSPKK